MKVSRASQSRSELDRALVELARFLAWVAVQDYLSELKRTPQSDHAIAASERPSESLSRGESP